MTARTDLNKEVKWLAFMGYFAFCSMILVSIVDIFNSPQNESISMLVPMILIGTLGIRGSNILNKLLKRIEQLEDKTNSSNTFEDG